jgi:CxxC motif-containing protein (DUF1111 family)
MRSRDRIFVCGALLVVSVPLVLFSRSAQTATEFGAPLPGLPGWAVSSFKAGRAAFMAVETPATGLGPVYNGESCGECHGHPVPGGSGASLEQGVTRFGLNVAGQRFDPLAHAGGPDLQRRSVASDLPGCHLAPEIVPAVANATSRRQPPPLFGLGLMEAIPDSAILANADPDDANGDGIAGRPNINAGVIGRFGWRATVPTLLQFVGLAMVMELGVTNHLFPNETSPQGGPIPPSCKLTPDVEDADGSRLVGHLLFVRLLGPPPRGPITDAVVRGDALFGGIGCALCHLPLMRTGRNAMAALDQKDVPLYSDVLVHFMGTELSDGIPEGSVNGGWWRTAPLWGLRVRKFLLHDGRTSDLGTAIQAHGGEAQAARDRFLALSSGQRADLLAFLRSL